MSDTHRTIDAVWRIESSRIIAGAARILRDIGLAEEVAQDALVAALEQWPKHGIPDNPGAWLMATARRRAIDLLRKQKRAERHGEDIGRELEDRQERAVDEINAAVDDPVGDELLSLIFAACHPILSTEARAALTLRVVGGLTTTEIARAFLVPEPTIAQRIVRAKRTLTEARVPFEVPRGAEQGTRLASVLGVLYLIFNEGYSATAGDDWMRPALCEDALRLGRVLAELVPNEPEVHGLVALMEIQASRSAARIGPSGEPILLLDQNRALWDYLLIRRGLAALERAEQLGGALGLYALAGRHRRLPRPRPYAAGNGLGQHYCALRRARRDRPVAGHRTEPRGRRLDGLRSGRRIGVGRRTPVGAFAGQVSPSARRPRRPAPKAGPLSRGLCGVRTSGPPYPERPRTRPAARTRPLLQLAT